VHISSDEYECPVCGSDDVHSMNLEFVVYRCRECGSHFEGSDESDAPKRVFARKMKNFKYKEEE
jgi:transposase-like protein